MSNMYKNIDKVPWSFCKNLKKIIHTVTNESDHYFHTLVHPVISSENSDRYWQDCEFGREDH